MSKTTTTILVALIIIGVVWYFLFYKKVEAIIIPGGELDVSNIPGSITFKGKEYKANGTEGTFVVDGKDMPSTYLFGNTSENKLLALPRSELYRPTCGADTVLGFDKYKIYDKDAKWCLYKKI